MKSWVVSMRDEEGKNHHVTVKAEGVGTAIDAAQRKLYNREKSLRWCMWEIWKVEMK